ncbi:hypothetical protein ACFRFH_11965 [Leifsonia sp. NPDC056824]|uniref:hypothetical protein n=1 Tax=Leifsonia sp. NPDC056824 TaxID=3345953 RepID=UPI0036CA556A
MSEFDGMDLSSKDDVYGTRSFRVDKLGRLTGVTFSTSVWRPGVNTAVCLSESRVFEVRGNPKLYEALTGMTPGEALALQRKRERDHGQRPEGVVGVIYNQLAYGVNANYYPPVILGSGGGMYVPDPDSLSDIDKKRLSEVPHPIDHCQHGFYGYYEGSNDYGPKMHGGGYVNGVIQASGATTLGTRGFRTSMAEIVAIHLPADAVVPVHLLVRRNYPDVPVFSTFESMVSEFPPSSGEAKVGPDADPEFWDRPV